MLESVMLIALGFLIATLFALIAVQLVWRRAVTLTTHKFTNDLDLEALKQNAERVSMLDVTLQDRHQEISALQAKNTQLEQTLASARDEAVRLNNDITDLHTHHAAAQVEAEARLSELAQLQAHIEDLEAAARSDVEQRNIVETHLKTLGETASRLIADMSAVATEIGSAQSMLTANTTIHEIAAQQTEAPTTAVEKVALMPFPTDDDDEKIGNLENSNETGDEALPDLAKIKAELSSLETSDASYTNVDDAATEAASTAKGSTEGFFADRIRKLAAGVNATA